jgi:putative hydrolase of the HAD superfamily
MKNLKVIAFDADDTLFINETYFAETEEKILWFNAIIFHQGISKNYSR